MENLSSTIFNFVIMLGVLASLVVAADINDDRIKEACGGTVDPATCFSTLSPAKDPNNTYVDPVELAELEVNTAFHLFSMASTAAGTQHWNDENMSKEDEDCFKECMVKMENACTAFDPYHGKINLSKVRSFIAEAKAKHVVWNCEI